MRRAVGATQRDILAQFMAESVMQCIAGGIAGIGLGFLVALLLRTYSPFPASVRTWVARDGRGNEFRGGIIFWDLSGGARVATGSGCRVEVGLMAIMTLAQARENFLAAMQTLRSSKVRSALTVLGIVIGVSSVISMAAIIQGLNKFVQDRVQSLGSRTYFLSRFPPGSDPSRWPERIRMRRYFEYDYAEFIRAAAPDVQNVTTVGTRGFFFGDSNLITGGDHSVEKVIVRGAEPEYTTPSRCSTSSAGASSARSTRSMRGPSSCSGAAISESLFPNTDALGKTVRINGAVYEVIGVFEHDQGLFLGPGVDIFAVIPLSNFKKQYPEAKELIMAFHGSGECECGDGAR